MGIISKSVAHACSGGARGFFKPNDQEYGEAAGVVKFHRDQEKPGRYVSEFRGPARVSCKHAHRAAQPRKAAQALLRSRDHWVRTLKLYRSNACETYYYCTRLLHEYSIIIILRQNELLYWFRYNLSYENVAQPRVHPTVPHVYPTWTPHHSPTYSTSTGTVASNAHIVDNDKLWITRPYSGHDRLQ